MKTRNKLLLLVITGLLTISSASADYRIYDNVSDFEKDKGSVCEAATDGCNNYFMTDGKVMWGTKKACPAEQKVQWTCTEYKSDVVTTKMLPTTVSETNIDKSGISTKLSTNDQNFYNTIKTRLDSKYQDAITEIVNNFELELNKYSELKQNRIKESLISKIESKISYLLIQYPQDTALPSSVNDKYLSYTLLKFELMK